MRTGLPVAGQTIQENRTVEKMNPDTAGRPVLIKGKTQLLFGGLGRPSENCVLNLKNKLAGQRFQRPRPRACRSPTLRRMWTT